MNSTRRGFLMGAAAVGSGAALGRRVAAALTGRSMGASAALGPIGSAQSAITHGPIVGHLTTTSATVWARCSMPGVYQLTAHGMAHDRAGQHHALLMALTMFNRARWTGTTRSIGNGWRISLGQRRERKIHDRIRWRIGFSAPQFFAGIQNGLRAYKEQVRLTFTLIRQYHHNENQ